MRIDQDYLTVETIDWTKEGGGCALVYHEYVWWRHLLGLGPRKQIVMTGTQGWLYHVLHLTGQGHITWN